MAYRNGNYSAFYAKEPFSESNLGANATKDFVYYNLLRAWKGGDAPFPFIESHDKNYNVRDGSDWEKTLKPRIHERLHNLKNISLFLRSITVNLRVLREEIDFGINTNLLPIIVVYPDYTEKSDIINCTSKTIRKQIKDLWDSVPIFRNSMAKVPTIHVPNNKLLIRTALKNEKFMVNTKGGADVYFYPC